MRSRHFQAIPLILVAVLALPSATRGQSTATPKRPIENPFPYAPDESRATAFSLTKATRYLDRAAEFWMRPNSCGACHANFAYVMARPLAGESPTLLAETRRFLEDRKPSNPRRFNFDAGSVSIAFALAWDDAHSGDKLRPSTRQALRRRWENQQPSGGWTQQGCGAPLPAETYNQYTVMLATLAAGIAPEGYAHTAEARDGLTRLRRYLVHNPPRLMHDDAMLLWASFHVDGLLTTGERDATVRSLLAAQGADGGWSMTALETRLKPDVARKQTSDGYGTAFMVFVLRQAGVPATRPEIARGVHWLRNNQRVSGRWVTPGAVGETEGGVGSRDLYAQNLGTAFAILALRACEESGHQSNPVKPIPTRGLPGLALRERIMVD